ncbi:ATP-binding protein [Sphingomonas populi]|uniref:ATP-binding protein n=1 Tax=Sphingomonas populi TaxID=2484750 RepID=A0A4V2DCA0_9SPHN|nr:terminase family protein [Sphingomonas populi]RZF60758.1 ATP-binding protein [Sphingomonas populi]
MSEDGVVELAVKIALLEPDEQAWLIEGLDAPVKYALNQIWFLSAHEGQYRPGNDWRVWLIRAGRGFGKTRAGAEWVSQIARNLPGARIALVGATIEDVTRVMVEGDSGILSVAQPGERIDWHRSSGELAFMSGARAFTYSAEAPEKLRGPQHHAAWCDEIAKWRRADAAWDNLMLGLRLGARQQVVVTTTPRAVPLLRRIMAMKGRVESHGRTHDNAHLGEAFIAAIEEGYGGTRLGRQEIDGELIEDLPGALWSRGGIEACRVACAPALVRVVVGVDPPAGSASGEGDACGIVAAGLGEDGHAYVIEDASVVGESPEGWARAVVGCAGRHAADRVVAEVNQGGQMVRSVLERVDPGLPLATVNATRGKAARAEPVSVEYARGRVHHVGAFPGLEDEMCGLVAGGRYQGPGRSPDRADALVWALAELLLGRVGIATVRGL